MFHKGSRRLCPQASNTRKQNNGSILLHGVVYALVRILQGFQAFTGFYGVYRGCWLQGLRLGVPTRCVGFSRRNVLGSTDSKL